MKGSARTEVQKRTEKREKTAENGKLKITSQSYNFFQPHKLLTCYEDNLSRIFYNSCTDWTPISMYWNSHLCFRLVWFCCWSLPPILLLDTSFNVKSQKTVILLWKQLWKILVEPIYLHKAMEPLIWTVRCVRNELELRVCATFCVCLTLSHTPSVRMWFMTLKPCVTVQKHFTCA